ncbi:MAG TPA: hypothetical protein VGM11_06000 [Acidobacteriaceae bacterium]
MIDIHPPHHAATTRRDFLIHLSTVVLGILIAIGLEQTVELVHRRHQRQELQQQLHSDAERILYDTQRDDAAMTGRLQFLRARADQVAASLEGHKLPSPGAETELKGDIPIDPAWQAAKSAGTLAVLPPEDIKVFTELDGMLSVVYITYQQFVADNNKLDTFTWSIAGIGSHDLDIESLTPEQKHAYLLLLIESYRSTRECRLWLRHLHGGTLAVAGGERDLKKIDLAERQFNNLP